jgi:L-2-hydroxycarboxylate dehydrogenase (NAD+)
MMNYRTKSVKIDILLSLMERMLTAVGCDAETATTLAKVHLESDMRGVGVQGLNHLINSHIQDFQSGKIDPEGKPSIVRESDSFALVDGGSGPGPIAGIFAANLAAQKGRKAGCCVIGIRNSHDIFQAGYYAGCIAQKGLVGVVFSDDVVPVVHPLGGVEPVIGSNPMAIAVPTENHPFLIDFAACATLPTYVRYAKRYGLDLPEGVAHDAAGLPTTDPDAVCDGIGYQTNIGAISPFGNKGYGLLLAIDFLSGALVGCDMGTDHPLKPGSKKGHFFLAINPAAFGDLEDFKRAASRRIKLLKDSKKPPEVEEIRIPGERSAQSLARCLQEGQVLVDEICWQDALKMAADLGISVPE